MEIGRSRFRKADRWGLRISFSDKACDDQ